MDNVLKIPSEILIRKFNVEFSYITKRNNKRLRTVQIKSPTRDEVEYRVTSWIEKYNKENPFRAYSNAKILECVEVDREIIVIN